MDQGSLQGRAQHVVWEREGSTKRIANSLVQEGLGVEPHCKRSRRACSMGAYSLIRRD